MKVMYQLVLNKCAATSFLRMPLTKVPSQSRSKDAPNQPVRRKKAGQPGRRAGASARRTCLGVPGTFPLRPGAHFGARSAAARPSDRTNRRSGDESRRIAAWGPLCRLRHPGRDLSRLQTIPCPHVARCEVCSRGTGEPPREKAAGRDPQAASGLP